MYQDTLLAKNAESVVRFEIQQCLLGLFEMASASARGLASHGEDDELEI